MFDTWELWELRFLFPGIAMSRQRACERTRGGCEKAVGGDLWAKMEYRPGMLRSRPGMDCVELIFM